MATKLHVTSKIFTYFYSASKDKELLLLSFWISEQKFSPQSKGGTLWIFAKIKIFKKFSPNFTKLGIMDPILILNKKCKQKFFDISTRSPARGQKKFWKFSKILKFFLIITKFGMLNPIFMLNKSYEIKFFDISTRSPARGQKVVFALVSVQIFQVAVACGHGHSGVRTFFQGEPMSEGTSDQNFSLIGHRSKYPIPNLT